MGLDEPHHGGYVVGIELAIFGKQHLAIFIYQDDGRTFRRQIPGIACHALGIQHDGGPGELFLAVFGTALHKARSAPDGVIAVDDGDGLVLVMGQLGGLDRLYHGGVELLGAGAASDVLDHEYFAAERLALPRLIANLLAIEHQLALVTDIDQRHLARFLDVVGKGQAGQQRQSKYEMFHPDDTPLLCYNELLVEGMGPWTS